ncbi:MAG: TadE/TadG family type IV pilus assembly protein [Planctomycetaceae bacterium]
MRNSFHQRTPPGRSGVAAAEFAVCLPILVVLLIGTIEACSMIYLKQTLSIAAYEAARVSTIPGAVTSDVQAAADAILVARGVNNPTVTISPANFEAQPPETWTTITVAAPGSANSVITGWYYDQQTVTAKATMMKEF